MGPPPGYRPAQAPRGRAGRAWLIALPLVLTLLVGGAAGVAHGVHRISDFDYSLPADSLLSHSTVDSSAPEKPSAAPKPSSRLAVHTLADNPLFADPATALPATRCPLSHWRTDPASASRFFRSALHCLNDAWSRTVGEAGLPFRPPRLRTPADGSGGSPCKVDGESFAAYYCPLNETLYLPFRTLETDYFGTRTGVYLAVLAHEYGHHVQRLSGVMTAANEQQYRQGGNSHAGLTTERRLELQAQCFSGMFVRAAYDGGGGVTATRLREAASTQQRGDRGGLRSHGTDRHNMIWWTTGARYNRTARCNTWRAPAATVG